VSLEGIRILVVEDEPDTREFLETFLRTHGAEVVTAASAAEALAELSSACLHTLVSDIGLPDVDGYDLLRRIRAHDVNAGERDSRDCPHCIRRSEDRTRALRAGIMRTWRNRSSQPN
jgi:CheY-like chemotaxis protein